MIQLILILFLAGTVHAADFSNVIGYYNAAASSSYDTTGITFWWRCEAADFSAGNTAGTEYSAGDDIASVYSGALFNTDAVKNGTNGLDIPTALDYVRLDTGISNIVSGAEGRIGFWMNVTTWGTGNTTIIRVEYQGTANRFYIYHETSGRLKWTWNDNGTTADTLTTTGDYFGDGTGWQFVEIAWKVTPGGTDDDYREIFRNGVSIGTDTTDIAAFAGEPDDIRIGDINNTTQDHHFDHIIMTKDSTKSLYESRNQDTYDNS